MLCINTLFVWFTAYLVGAIPTGYWLARYVFSIDITQHGSKNIGASNAGRVLGGIRYFFLVFLIDAFKSYSVLYLCRLYGDTTLSFLYIPACLLMVGNSYSLFIGGKGGKGVATAVGSIFALLSYVHGLIFMLSWIVFYGVICIPSYASLGAMVVCIGYDAYWCGGSNVIFLGLLYLWIGMRHWVGIRHILMKLRA